VQGSPPARRGSLRRALAACAFLAALAASPAHAQEPASPDWRVGSTLGFEIGIGDEDYSTVKVRLDAERPLRELSAKARLGLVVSLGLSHPSGKESIPVAWDPYTGGYETADLTWDANVFELVPSVRFLHATSPKVALFADGGLGFAWTTSRATLPPELAALGVEALDDGAAGVVRLAGGIVWTPTPRVRVGLEAVGLHVRFGGGVGSAFNLAASISHQL
jgi:hypothetical protein